MREPPLQIEVLGLSLTGKYLEPIAREALDHVSSLSKTRQFGWLNYDVGEAVENDEPS